MATPCNSMLRSFRLLTCGHLPLTEQSLQMNNELQPKFPMGQPSGVFDNSRFKLLAHKHRGHKIPDIFLSCSEPKRNVVEPSLISEGTATMIRCWWWWCMRDVQPHGYYVQVTN